jgi:undecaprenyl pyrophosphate synthase
MKTKLITSAPKVGSSAMVRRKCAAIYGPVPGTDGTKWVCIALDGNLRWKTAAECDSEEDAKQWAKRTRNHWRKFSDMQVCTRLAPNK